jgi:hypothetical protein
MKFITMDNFVYLFADGIYRTCKLAYDVESDILKKAKIKTDDGWRWPTCEELNQLTQNVDFKISDSF